MADWTPQSRAEEILFDTINGEPYDGLPQSRIEELLLELKEVIEEGGGGGGTSDYTQLSNKPSINNVTLVGNKTSDDLGLEGAYTTITYAQWQAMTDAQRESGKYYVTDVPGYGSQSGENVFGVFIDTDRVIVATTTFRTDTSYTATEDCAVVVGVPTSANAESAIKINNVKVGAIYSQSGITAAYDTFLVKKGQTITIEPSYTQGDSSYTVYGLTFGTNGIFAPQIYDTTEREVGVWADGKPLYQKSYIFTFNSSTSVVLDSTLTCNDITLIESTASFKRSADDNNVSPMLTSDVARIFATASGVMIESTYDPWMLTVTGVVTIKYTKISDVAGSGSWTPTGVPAVHYSTDEHVVGTWVDGKTLYQKTIVTNAQVALSDNSWTAVPFASGDVPSDADTMFCTEWLNPIDSHLICDNRTRFIYDNGAIKGATSQTGGQTVPAGLTLTIRYTKAS